MPIAYHGTTRAVAQQAVSEGLKKPAPVFTEDRRRAARKAEALLVIDPEQAGMARAPGYKTPHWWTDGDIPAEALNMEIIG
jgi:hypothetical protein